MTERSTSEGFWARDARLFGEDIRTTVLITLLNMDDGGSIPKHKFWSWPDAEHWTARVRSNVVNLISQLQSAIESFAALPELPEVPSKREVDARSRLLDPVNELFARCVIRPAVNFEMDGHEPGKRLFVDDAITESHNPVEVVAMLGIRELFRTDRLQALKQCSSISCKKWFVCKRSDQRWCSQLCRQREFQGTEEFRMKRKETYERKKQLKNGKLKSKGR